MSNAIELRGLTKSYGSHRGIAGLDLEVRQGETFGFIGPNGAGKSTTIRCLLGLIKADSGSAEVLGLPVGKKQREILARTGYMPSEAMFHSAMTVREVIRFAANVRGKDCTAEAKRLCEALGMDTSRRVSELSLGNRKKVSIVCALQHRPELLILDEPTSGLDPLMQETFFSLVGEAVKDGATCFLSSHVLSEVKRRCDRAGIIKEGRLVAADTVDNLTSTSMRSVRVRGIDAAPETVGVHNPERDGEYICFGYDGAMPELMKALSESGADDVLIGEPSIEEVFMHYYS